jgi:hypothetical protein
MTRRAAALACAILLAVAPAARAQQPGAGEVPPPAQRQEPRKGKEAGQMTHVHPPSPDQAKMLHLHHEMPATGRFGPYPLTRESSGTSWQPESSIHEGLHFGSGAWTSMIHGWATAVWDDQGGPRGGDGKLFGANMLMGRMHGPWGPGTLGLSAMMSAEPWSIGASGYPLLLQTGESADGRTPLVDRQHPHDMMMELAMSYALATDRTSSIFVYAALPGEPALGPPVFMHRMSGEWFPDAPIGHHWLDSTHITYGVLTGGLVDGPWKFEGSLFRGREPDEHRTDFEEPKLDSHSFRLSYNPNANLAIQSSYGRLHSPEALAPDVDVDRTTVSAIANTGRNGRFTQATVAWGRNHERPGSKLDAVLIETATRAGRALLLVRVEQVEKDDLFIAPDPRAGLTYDVEKLSGGFAYDVWARSPVSFAVGALASLSRLPDELDPVYGKNPISGMFYLRATLK